MWEARRKRGTLTDNEQGGRHAAELSDLEWFHDESPLGLGTVDAALHFVRVNKRLAEINGLSPEAHVGRPIGEVLGAIAPRILPLVQGVVDTGNAVVGLDIEGPAPPTPDRIGHWRVSYFPIRDRGDRVLGVGVLVEDVSTLRRTERELRVAEEEAAQLRASEARYRGLVEHVQDIPFSVNAEGFFTYVGPQVEALGYAPADVLGRHFTAYVHPADRERVMAVFANTLKHGVPTPTTFRVQTPTRGELWFEEVSMLGHDTDGTPLGFTGFLRDISERKATEGAILEQRERLQRLTVRLAADRDEERRRIAHDLHEDIAQLLAACALQLERLMPEAGGNDRASAARLHGMLRDATNRVRSLGSDLGTAALEELGLVAALGELARALRAEAGLRVRVTADPACNRLDPGAARALLQITRVLLDNVARHAGTDHAELTLSATDTGEVALAVSDTGRGFDPKSVHGEGLSLVEVRARVEERSGTLEIDSAPGHGARVTVRLPHPI